MLIRENTAKNLKARFYQEGETMELRIPLSKRRANLVRRVIKLSNGKGNLLAGELAIVALSILDEIPRRELNTSQISRWIMATITKKYYEIFRRFEKEGWIDKSWRRDILQEMKDRLAKNDFEPEDMDWVRTVFKAHGGVESPIEEPKAAA